MSALAAGALVATTTSTASAAPISNEYFCDGPTTDFPMFLDSDVPGLAVVPEAGRSPSYYPRVRSAP